MDEREQQRLDTVFRYLADARLAELALAVDGVKSQFALANRLHGGEYFKALINAMGAAVHGFATDAHPAALKISKSHDACIAWTEFVRAFQTVVFADWERKLAPSTGRYGPMQPAIKAAIVRLVGQWSDKLDGFMAVGGFDFDDAPSKPKPQIGLDGWPIQDGEIIDSDFTAMPPKVEPKPLPKSALASWWDGLGADRELSQVKLLVRVRADHPEHFISRDRIRQLAAGRKRGRRPIGGKATAE